MLLYCCFFNVFDVLSVTTSLQPKEYRDRNDFYAPCHWLAYRRARTRWYPAQQILHTKFSTCLHIVQKSSGLGSAINQSEAVKLALVLWLTFLRQSLKPRDFISGILNTSSVDIFSFPFFLVSWNKIKTALHFDILHDVHFLN